MKDILKTLIEIPTVSTDLRANTEAVDYIADFLQQRGLHITRHKFGGHPALVATVRKTKKPTLLLAGHIDVVPAPESEFKMIEKDGRIYGRGIYDMKAAIAAYLHIIDTLKDTLSQYDLGVMITSDEELGGENGVLPLVEDGYSAKACLLLDGGQNWTLEASTKGLFWIQLSATGKAAHGSRPWQGDNAIDRIMQAIHTIRQAMPATFTPETNTFNVGTIDGGNSFNQVADHCRADLDFRFTSEAEGTKIRALIDRVCEQYNLTYKVMTWGPAFAVDMDNPYLVAWRKSFEKVMQRPLQTMRSLAGSDARWFGVKGIPTIVTYPEGGNYHGDNEWVSEETLQHLQDVIRDYIERVARTK